MDEHVTPTVQVFRVQFVTENAAFCGGRLEAECADILRRVASQLEAGYTSGTVMDSNGNGCGSWTFSDEEIEDQGSATRF